MRKKKQGDKITPMVFEMKNENLPVAREQRSRQSGCHSDPDGRGSGDRQQPGHPILRITRCLTAEATSISHFHEWKPKKKGKFSLEGDIVWARHGFVQLTVTGPRQNTETVGAQKLNSIQCREQRGERRHRKIEHGLAQQGQIKKDQTERTRFFFVFFLSIHPCHSYTNVCVR